ncbi:hypothetical protein C8R47DRAFT_1265647 [Mycena vitilis]|nr:hypothetical protein C8R47DRAFT_1265647 [Mycena vitilis]
MAPVADGGKNLLDLRSRNDAIQIMKLQSYLELRSSERATWGFIADSVLEKRDVKDSAVDANSHINMFLQDWNPNQRKRPPHLKEMLACAEKYGVIFDTIEPSIEIREQLPLFHHFGEDPAKTQLNNTPACKCLRENHNVQTAGEGKELAIRFQREDHKPAATCKCILCNELRRTEGCNNPHSCARTVESRLGQLLPKWNPQTQPRDDNDGKDEESSQERSEATVFHAPKEIQSLTDGFRIFTKDSKHAPSVPTACGPHPQNTDPLKTVKVFISANIRKTTEGNVAGGGVWYGQNDLRNTELRVPEYLAQTVLNAEALSALTLIQRAHPETTLNIHSSRNLLKKMFINNLERWEDRGWVGVTDKAPLQTLSAALKARVAPTNFMTAQDDERVERGYSEARSLAQAGCTKETPDLPILVVPIELQIKGAKLSKLTQAVAYAAIKEAKAKPVRKATNNKIQQVQAATKFNFNNLGVGPTRYPVAVRVRIIAFAQDRNLILTFNQ